ncbi:MAG TPA: condensation domain-containing protein, partial [Herpetosiphonaceae bacterium]
MLFHTLYDQGSGLYVTHITLTLRGNLHVPSLQRAWELIIERHPVLRTAFVWERRDEPFQVVYRQVRLPWQEYDLRDRSPIEQEEQLAAFLADDLSRGFDLDKAPLMRLVLFQTAADTYQFVWSQHHLLMDGWSLPLVLNEVFTAYEAFAHDREIQFAPSRPYRDYIAWLQRQDMAQAEAFWRQFLEGVTAQTPLGVDRPVGPDAGTAESIELETYLSTETTGALHDLARQHGLTMNTLVQGAWAILLSRYSGEPDVVFGATVSGRPAELPGVEQMIGLFINTLPVRVPVRPAARLLDWLKALQAQQAELRQYEYSPLVQIQGWSDVPRGQPLFESIVVFENYPSEAGRSDRGNRRSLEVSTRRSMERSNYPLNLTTAVADKVLLRVTYDRRRFEPETIARLLAHLQRLLAQFAAQPTQPLAALSLLAPAERLHWLRAWHAPAVPVPAPATLPHLIEAQAARTPDALAVVVADAQLSYHELNARANQLAHALRARGVGPDTRVGLCLERSLDLVVALLAVLKAGGAYVPLDPTYPAELLGLMLRDAQVALLLTHAALRPALPGQAAAVLCLDTAAELLDHQPTHNLPAVDPDHLAYV